ncbi:MAG: YibE/F family protein, partial [Candidatus Brocadiae bacterium]|nr:YibE/F family protein [Candidatus Brocadiia bacterium]
SQLASLVPLAPTGWADRWLILTNYEEIACELARAAAAAGGMALCVPAAAAVAALLHGKRAKAEAERVPRVSIRPRLPLRPLLAVLACLAVAGLADELTLRSYCGGPGRTAHETSGRVVAFDRPAVEPSARSNDPHDRTFFRSQPVVLQPYFGPHAGHLLPARLILGPNPSHHLLLRPDSAVHLSVDGDAGATDVKLYKPPLRYRWGLVAMLVTAVMLVAAGGRAGVRVLLVMAGAAAVMLGVLLPLLARGYPPLPVAAGCCAGMLVAVFAITGSVGRKAFAAMLGSAVGIALAAGLLLFSNWWLDITGTQSVPAHLLEWLGDKLHVAYDHAGLLAASLLVALVGLMMDTAVTVAAGVAQVCAARADVSRREAAAAGLSISRDVVGTMILTLLFAFVGLRLPAFLLPSALGLSPAELINSEAGASQILQALVGSIALASTGPAAAIAAALLMAGRAPQATRPNRASLWRPARAIVAVLAIVGIAAGGGAWWTLRQKRLSQAVLPPLPGEVDALIADAAHARRQREFGHALLALWKARDRGPHDPRTRVELAYTYMGRGWAMHAEREIQGALDAGADDTMAHYVAGVVYAWTGKLDKAERHLRRAIVLDPGNAPARDAVKRLFGP